MQAQLVPRPPRTLGLQRMLAAVNATAAAAAADAELVFLADLPPLGYSAFELIPGAASPIQSRPAGETAVAAAMGARSEAQHADEAAVGDDAVVVVDNGAVELRFDALTGLLASATPRGGPSVRLTAAFRCYNASDGLESDEGRGQASGAYIFRPNGACAPAGAAAVAGAGGSGAARLSVARGEVVTEVRQRFGGGEEWATLVTR